MAKDRFFVDSSNCLIIMRGKNRIIPAGRFTISEDNSLVYWLNEPAAWREKFGLDQEFKFEGNWKLDDNYDLCLILTENDRQLPGDKIVLKGEIFSSDRDTLAFEMRSQDKTGKNEFQILKFSGFWSTDQQNNIVFSADKSTDPDVLNLGAGWKLNKDQQIVFNYEKTRLKTKVKDIRVITFSGSWQIRPEKILSYVLSGGSRSRFDFRAQVETPNVYPQAGKIKFRLGAGIRDEKLLGKVITLYGTWKFSRKLGLSFDMDYGKNDVRSLEFGADINIAPKDKVILSLVSRERKPLGLKVTFSHRFLKKLDAEAYLKFKALREESGIEAGVRIPF
jgi:hypothetical protein